MFRIGKKQFIHKLIYHLIQKYFFHDNPTWNINYLEFELIELELMNLMWN